MIVKRIYHEGLAQASWLLGCARTGAAIVIDPTRDAAQYVQLAAAEGVRVTHVTETHIHADFVSGARELAARAGAALYLSGEGGPDWQYGYARQDGATLLRDGDTITVGNIRLTVVHTPGHTPEHISFLVTDGAVATEPMAIVTGDFVFVGDVGRPDLLEKAAKVTGTMEQAARTLYASLQRFARYPDWLQVWPGHGAGSACGKGLSAVPQSTVGYERRYNWAFTVADEAAFVRDVLAGQPEPPTYFAQMKRVNRDGPRVLNGLPQPACLDALGLAALTDAGAVIVDTRGAAAHAAGHVPGSISIPLNKSFSTWAGWLVPYDADFYLIVDDDCPRCLEQAVRDLAMIGLDRVAGSFGSAALAEWAADGRPLERTAQVGARELSHQMAAGEVRVIDVRGRSEWEAGHLPGVRNIPVGLLREHLHELPADRPIVLQCQGGGRSAIAASVLQAAGRRNVVNLVGGFADWQASGLPVEREPANAPPEGGET